MSRQQGRVIANALVLWVVDDLHRYELRAVGHDVEIGPYRLVLSQDPGNDYPFVPPGLVLEHLNSVGSEMIKKINT